MHNIAFNIHIQFITDYIFNQGEIVGKSLQKSIISLNNVCINDKATFGASDNINQTGLFGSLDGNISISNTQIIYIISSQSLFQNFGIIGNIGSGCIFGIFNSINIIFSLQQKTKYQMYENNVASLIGLSQAIRLSLNNIIFTDVNVSSNSNAAILCGNVKSANLIENKAIIINNANISSLSEQWSQSGGLVAWCQQANISFENIQINSSHFEAISTSTYQVFSSSVITNVSQSNILIKQCNIFNVTVFTQCDYESESAGLLAHSMQSSQRISQVQLMQTNISSNSFASRTSGLIVITFNSTTSISNSIVNSMQINSLYRVQSDFQAYWCLSSGIISHSINSQISILHVQVQNSHIQVSSKQRSCASGLFSFSEFSELDVHNIGLYYTIIWAQAEQQPYSAGIIAYNYGSQITYQNDSINEIHVKYCNINSTSLYNLSYAGGISAFDYYVQANISNIILQYTQLNAVGIQLVLIGGLSACIQTQSIVKLENINIINSQIIGHCQVDLYSGGIIGTLQNSQLVLSYSSVRNSNISAQVLNINIDTNRNCVVGGIIGYIYQSSAQLIDIQSVNNNLNSSGYITYVSALIGSQRGFSNLNSLVIQNSVIQSINIWYIGSYNLYGFAIEVQTPATTQISINITKTYSSGISTVNNVQITNCAQIQATIVNGEYVIPVNGC
ncbi:Hypothetical_protein [Hexamita inflata]|uniref:Hypothetical_protein n=1 Tax=Hexamita inflata TaxID=28002 RepID=A0ABP1HHY7_9EUKA